MPDHIKAALAVARHKIDKAADKTDTRPTKGQKEAGNYRKGKIRIHGLDVSIENPKGSQRKGVGRDGKPWSVTMRDAHYGYVKGTRGNDGDNIDVYVGPDLHSDRVWIVDQIDKDTGVFDEHKCLLCFKSGDAAFNAYQRAFSDGKGHERAGAMTQMSIDEFKRWLKSGQTDKPIGKLDMPLIGGNSRAAVSRNIATERDAGKPQRQAVVIALNTARRSERRADGGGVQSQWHEENVYSNGIDPPRVHECSGYGVGPVGSALRVARAWGGATDPFHAIKTVKSSVTGGLKGDTMGRADHVMTSVPGGSYILPADHVAHMGQGNTNAGIAVLDRMFKPPKGEGMLGPVPHIKSPHMKLPKAPKVKMASGGKVPVKLSDGEYAIPPDVIAEQFGNLNVGHRALDKWVMNTRNDHIKALADLPPPAKADQIS